MSTTKRVSFIRRYADVGVLEIPMGVNVIINDGPCAHLDKAYPLNNWNKPYYRVKRVYKDYIDPSSSLFDGGIYSHDGKFIGRESECFDGPKKFEPCLSVDDFTVVDAPPWVNTVK